MFQHEIVDVTKEQLPFKVIVHKNTSATIPKHWHRSFELSFTANGKIDEFIINGQHYAPTAGTILVINPNEVHAISGSTKDDEENSALSILIPYSFMTEYIPEFSYRFYEIPPEQQRTLSQQQHYSELQQYFYHLFQVMEQPDAFSSLKILSLVYDILYHLTKAFSSVREIKNDFSVTTTEEFAWIDSVLVYIQQYFASPLTVGELAEANHLAPSYFSRKFKKYMDMSVMEYVAEIRLQAAFQQIAHTNRSIKAISDSCGFANHKSLISKFKKSYGMTPLNYRQNLKVSHKNQKK